MTLTMKTIIGALFVLFIFLLPTTNSFVASGIDVRNTPIINNCRTIYVDDDNIEGPWEGTQEHPFKYIQDGINDSEFGDIVFVLNGTYKENIVINRSIYLVGEKKNSTILDGMYGEILITIVSDEVSIKNFTIINSGGDIDNAGIKIYSNYNIIKNCIIYRTKTGISLYNSSFNEINNCSFSHNGEGILLKSSDNNIIHGSTFAHNAIGIHSDDSDDNSIKYSYLNNNGISCFMIDSSECEIHHCNISDNSNNHGGIFLTRCLNIAVTNSNIRHNGIGVYVEESESITVKDSELCWNTHFAFFIEGGSYDITVSYCEIINNFRYGIYVVEDSICTICYNNIYSNMLYSLFVKNSQCASQRNYWGSPFGPSFTELRRSSRISFKLGKVQFIPWIYVSLSGIGADWKDNEEYLNNIIANITRKHIELPGEDTDEDGVPDWWEEKWGYDPLVWDDHTNLDPDQDALNNIEECYTDKYGSNPRYRDIFLEFDWMESLDPNKSNKPSVDLLDAVKEIFNKHDINLHVDLGDLDGGEEIPFCTYNFTFAKLRDLYWNYFLHNDLNNPRKGIFHYGVICNYCPDLNFPFVGWDHFDSFAISAQWLKEKLPYYRTDRLIVGGAVHQLGSTIGLLADTHGGNDNILTMTPFTMQWWRYRNYKSCMNYYYKYRLFSYSDGTHGSGDFDDWSNLDFSFFKNSHFEWPKQ